LYGVTLTAKTLRVGFPTADVVVYDNGSIPEAKEHIKDAYEGVGCQYVDLNEETQHHTFIERVLNVHMESEEPVVILDPDLIFWENMEDMKLEGLMKGRYIPKFDDVYSKAVTMERLHTSFLVIPNPKALIDKYNQIKSTYFELVGVTPLMLNIEGVWTRWDTGAALYATIKDECHVFSEEELDKYDHLFCGSHFDLVQSAINSPEWAKAHENARSGNLTALKGMYKAQEIYFNGGK
jgi:hypothetical protein